MVFAGKVIDKTTGSGVPYASIKIYTSDGRYTGIGTAADGAGVFKTSTFQTDILQDRGTDLFFIAFISSSEYEDLEVDIYQEITDALIPLTRKVKELEPVIVTSDPDKDKKNMAWLLLIPLAVAASGNKKKVGEIGFNIPTVLTAGAALLLFKGFDVLNNIFSFFGLGKDKADQAAGNDASNPDSPLKGKLYVDAPADKKTAVYNYMLAGNRATNLGDTLISSFGQWGGLNDDEAQAKGVFKTFRTQLEASCFAYIWTDVWYYPDLNEWLRGDAYPNDRLSNDEIADIISYLKNLPKY